MTFSRLIGTTTATVLGFGVAVSASAQTAQAPYKTLPAGQAPTKTYPAAQAPAAPPKTYPAAQAPAAPPKTYPAAQAPAAPPKTYPAAQAPAAPPKTYPAAQAPAAPPKTYPAAQAPAAPPKTYPAAQAPGCSLARRTRRLRLRRSRQDLPGRTDACRSRQDVPGRHWPDSGNAFQRVSGHDRCSASSAQDRLPGTCRCPRGGTCRCPRSGPGGSRARGSDRGSAAGTPGCDPRRQEDLIASRPDRSQPDLYTPVTTRPGSFFAHTSP